MKRRVRLQLLKDSIDYYQHFIDQTTSDPTLGADNPQLNANLALANSRIGDLKARMNAKQDALVYQENALALWQKLVADEVPEPDKTEYRQSLAKCRNNLGMLLVDLGRPKDAVVRVESCGARAIRDAGGESSVDRPGARFGND